MTTLRIGGWARPQVRIFTNGPDVQVWATLHAAGRDWSCLAAAPTVAEACDAAVDQLLEMVQRIYQERETVQRELDEARTIGLLP